jgi:hypothetical protein
LPAAGLDPALQPDFHLAFDASDSGTYAGSIKPWRPDRRAGHPGGHQAIVERIF